MGWLRFTPKQFPLLKLARMKIIGFWDSGKSFITGEPVQYVPGKCRYEDLEQLLSYFEENPNHLLIDLYYHRCHICNIPMDYGGSLFTDGKFVWPGNIGHHIQEHGYCLPPELVDRIRKAGYQPRKLSRIRLLWLWWMFKLRVKSEVMLD